MSAVAATDWAGLQRRYELDVYGKRGPTLVRGEGATVWDDSGRAYIDCVGGQGAANLGHANPRVVAAIQRQAGRLISCPGMFYNDVKARYLEKLLRAAPRGLARAFLCNSGAEAVEAALKFARLATGRSGVVAVKRGFHGRTFGALSATHNPKYTDDFGPLVPGFAHVRLNDVEALRAAVSAETAAVIVEIVQGEGGVRPASPAFLRAARALCDRHGALLIVDEIQTGFGRTGALFACDRVNLRPDLLCLAKSIAGGAPMGATLVNARVDIPVGKHGSTFGGNPLACAAAEAALDELIERDLPGQGLAKGEALMARIRAADLSAVRETRGMGLMIGIELKSRVRPVLERLMDAGVLALPAGATVLRLLPPLVIAPEELTQLYEALVYALAA